MQRTCGLYCPLGIVVTLHNGAQKEGEPPCEDAEAVLDDATASRMAIVECFLRLLFCIMRIWGEEVFGQRETIVAKHVEGNTKRIICRSGREVEFTLLQLGPKGRAPKNARVV